MSRAPATHLADLRLMGSMRADLQLCSLAGMRSVAINPRDPRTITSMAYDQELSYAIDPQRIARGATATAWTLV